MSVTPQVELPTTLEDRDPDVPNSGSEVEAATFMPNYEALRDGINEHTHTELEAIADVIVIDEEQQTVFLTTPEDFALAIGTATATQIIIADADGNNVQIQSQSGLNLVGQRVALGQYLWVDNDGRIGFFGNDPVAQQPKPVTLDDVVAVLVAFGLVAPA